MKNTNPLSYNSDDMIELPEPVGITPIGVLRTVSLSDLHMIPLII